MFNPKERLEQIRKSKTQHQADSSASPSEPSPPPLFSTPQSDTTNFNQNQLIARMAKLQNTVNQMSSELSNARQTISSLRRDNSEMETKLLKMEYENSQLKVTNKSIIDKHESSGRKEPGTDRVTKPEREESAIRRVQSRSSEVSQALLPEVEESLEQIKKQPLQNILHRKEKNFRALRIDPRQAAGGNKMLREFAGICKDYGKTLKKPVLVLKLQAQDFE